MALTVAHVRQPAAVAENRTTSLSAAIEKVTRLRQRIAPLGAEVRQSRASVR